MWLNIVHYEAINFAGEVSYTDLDEYLFPNVTLRQLISDLNSYGRIKLHKELDAFDEDELTLLVWYLFGTDIIKD